MSMIDLPGDLLLTRWTEERRSFGRRDENLQLYRLDALRIYAIERRLCNVISCLTHDEILPNCLCFGRAYSKRDSPNQLL